MNSKALKLALAQDLPVLFVYIGWGDYYDGTEAIVGGHGWLKRHPRNNTEGCAFVKGADGLFRCGIGRGSVPPGRIHVVYVARDPATHVRKVVGLYACAHVKSHRSWIKAETRRAYLVPTERRPAVPVWPGDQGMRRWAWRGGHPGAEYLPLRAFFEKLSKGLGSLPPIRGSDESLLDQTYSELAIIEGRPRRMLIAHRTRETKLRRAKLRQAMQERGRLVCEVPGCGFDFQKRYGDHGFGFAHVHHLRPLNKASAQGRRQRLVDLAIVCANCHAMIHKGRECLSLAKLGSFIRRRS